MRNIKAKCACGATEFVARHKPPLAASDRLACAECGKEVTYGELLNQIGEEAARQAQAALERLRRRRPRRRT